MTTPLPAVVGFDIGGVHLKMAHVVRGRLQSLVSLPFEIQHRTGDLTDALRAVHPCPDAIPRSHHAVTLTAELSQRFGTKAEGVAFVLEAVEAALPGAPVAVYGTDGAFRTPAAARRDPLRVASANWHATATVVGRQVGDAILVDMGSTTTDVIPVVGGAVRAEGLTDPARLTSGELVYTGVLRTPVEAIVRSVPFGPGTAGVSAEGWAIAGDVHLWLGVLPPAAYQWPTPDGRPTTRAAAGDRLRRVVCADASLLDDHGVTRIAEAVQAAQVAQVRQAIAGVRRRWPQLDRAVVTGLGADLAADAAGRAGLRVERLASLLGDDARNAAAAAAVARLLAEAGTA